MNDEESRKILDKLLWTFIRLEIYTDYYWVPDGGIREAFANRYKVN